MNLTPDPAERILDAALELARQRGWDALHLHEVARALDVPLAELRRHYSQKDDLAEAWFDRADRAMIAAASAAGWTGLEPRERLRRTILAWLDALAPQRRITAAMLRYKLQPEHIHLQALGVTRVSRTVQWIREAACLESRGLRRELEEVALTTLYLATFACWLSDGTPGFERTHALLDALLARAERAALALDRMLPAG